MKHEKRLQALEAAKQLDNSQPLEIWAVARNPDGSEGERILLYRWCHHTGRYLTPLETMGSGPTLCRVAQQVAQQIQQTKKKPLKSRA